MNLLRGPYGRRNAVQDSKRAALHIARRGSIGRGNITSAGSEWTYAGDMTIDANVASTTTILYIQNDATGGTCDVYVENDVRIGGGLYVGGVASDPAPGVVQATAACSGWLPFVAYDQLPNNISVSGNTAFIAVMHRAMTLKAWRLASFVATTNTGAAYWTMDLITQADGVIATFNTASDSADDWVLHTVTSFSPDTFDTSDEIIWINATKTGAPGNLSLSAPGLYVL